MMRGETLPAQQAQSGTPRFLSPSALRSGGRQAMLAEQVRAEVLQNARVPEFLVGIVVFPVMLYLMFGLSSAAQTLPEGTQVSAFLMASFAAYGVLGLAIFSFGVDLALERGRGWHRLMRATPLPAWVYFAGKLAMALGYSVAMLTVLFGVAAVLAGVRLPLLVWAQLVATLLFGGLAFGPLGFTLGYWASPRGASPIANLVYLPLAFASGRFIPLINLPQALQTLAPYLPTYHFAQLVWQAVGTPGDVALLAGVPSDRWQHALWLVATFVLFSVLAILGYRRDQRRVYG